IHGKHRTLMGSNPRSGRLLRYGPQFSLRYLRVRPWEDAASRIRWMLHPLCRNSAIGGATCQALGKLTSSNRLRQYWGNERFSHPMVWSAPAANGSILTGDPLFRFTCMLNRALTG